MKTRIKLKYLILVLLLNLSISANSFPIGMVEVATSPEVAINLMPIIFTMANYTMSSVNYASNMTLNKVIDKVIDITIMKTGSFIITTAANYFTFSTKTKTEVVSIENNKNKLKTNELFQAKRGNIISATEDASSGKINDALFVTGFSSLLTLPIFLVIKTLKGI